MPNRPENLHASYHAHIYFDADTEAAARQLCIATWEHCHVGLGRFHRQPIGPHPEWSCQLTFDTKEFDRLIPWLDKHRDGFNILVHPLTGDALAEHSTLATWLGDAIDLKLDIFSSAASD